jgi:hypothetical protein
MSLRRATQPRAGTLSEVKTSLIAALFLLFVPGCTVVGHERVAGWPELRIVEHHVPHHVMRERCAKYAPPMMSPEACAEFYFAQGECHLWFSADFPPPRDIIEHEYLHCQGHDHVGESVLAGILENYLGSLSASVGPSAAQDKEISKR